MDKDILKDFEVITNKITDVGGDYVVVACKL